MPSSFKVGLIGYGLAGSAFHAPLIQGVDGLNLSHIVSSRQAQIRSRYSDVTILTTTEALLQTNVDLVIVATPPDTHYEIVHATLMANKHVVVDKPFTVTSQEAEKLIKLAKQRNRQLFIYQNRRWDNDFLTIKQLLDNKTLGSLYHFESHFDRFRLEVDLTRLNEQARDGNGKLHDLGSHLIDQVLVLFGMPQWIWADIASQRPHAIVDDYFHIMMGYEQLRVILHTGAVVKAHPIRFILHGDKGSYVKHGFDPQEVALREGKTPQDKHWGQENQENHGVLTLADKVALLPSVSGNYPEFYRAVYRSLCYDDAFPVTLEQAYNTIKMIEFAQKSHTEKRTISL